MRIGVKGALAALTAFVCLAGPAHAGGRVLVLSDDDALAYQAAFAAIDRGDWRGAHEALVQARDQSLIGNALARQYLTPAYAPSYEELADWLHRYADEPYADEIAAKARALRPGASLPKPAPAGRRGSALFGASPPGDSAAARREIEAAAEAFAAGNDGEAARLADQARGGPRAGQAEYRLGLIAFRAGDYGRAAAFFDAASTWKYWDAWGAAGARYWAARAHLAAGNAHGAMARFKAALAYPSTFYGQLAESQLGRESGLRFEAPTLDEQTALSFMRRHQGARRAAALAQIGRLSDVEQELRALHLKLPPTEDRTFLDFADALAAPSAQLRAAEYGGPAEGWGFCPTTSFAPENGFRLDRAALLAVARQESRYSPVAVSSSNARGLMQLLPSTAADMDPSGQFRAAPEKLEDPGSNMRLGQSYLEWLLAGFVKDGDLAKLFAAYNGGPGWLSRWLAGQPDQSDPLMMIESLPRTELRDYAQRVLAHMALCRKRFGQEAAEFDALASGKPARYVRLDR